MNKDLLKALSDICSEKGIDKEIILEALEAALIAAYKKNFQSEDNVEVTIDREKGGVAVYSMRTVVDDDDVYDQLLEIAVSDARKISGNYEVGDKARVEVTPANFGRVAATTAKQVITQRLREVERGIVYDKLSEKANDIMTGQITRIDRDNVFVDMGSIEAMLSVKERPRNEEYEVGQRLKFYVSEVKNASKGTQVVISRTHPGLVRKLFTQEVPEIADGIVEIKSIAREAGSRTKIAVYAENPDIDPQGACIGPKGSRVQAIGSELGEEKIDIVKWSEDPAEFIKEALSPSTVLSVEINEEEHAAMVTVPEHQLSLAIGKAGQNVRLAARLTGWKIDISAQ